jgi:hypothetical protein
MAIIRRKSRKLTRQERDVSAPTKSDVARWSYYKRVSRVIGDLNEQTYRLFLAPEILAKHFIWMNQEWEKVQKTLNKPRIQKKKVNRRARQIRTRITKNTTKPSLSFSNKVVNRYVQLIKKSNEDIKKLSVPPEVETKPKRKPKLSRQDKIVQLKKKQCTYVTYLSDFIQVYYDFHGITKNLISALLKVNCLEYLFLYYNLYIADPKNSDDKTDKSKSDNSDKTDKSKSDKSKSDKSKSDKSKSDKSKSDRFVKLYIDPSLVDSDSYDRLLKEGIPVDRDIRIYLSVANKKEILKNLTEKFDSKEILSHLTAIKHSSVMTELVRQGIISSGKATTKAHLKKLNLSIVIPIIKAGKYSPTITDINQLFKPKTQKRKRRYYWRRNPSYNTSLSNKTEEIEKILRIMIGRNIKIPYSKAIHTYLISHSDPDMICDIIDCQNNPDYPYDKKWEKMRESVKIHSSYYRRSSNNLLNDILESDDIDRFKKLIEYNILPISELHHQNRYLIKAITNGATEIATYMIDYLHVKLLNWNPRSLWGWNFSRRSEQMMIRDLNFMHRLGIPISSDILGTFLSNKKSKVVTFLLDVIGFKIDKSHLKYIKLMDIKSFNKYADEIGVDKLKMLSGLARAPKVAQHRYYWGRRRTVDQKKKNAIALNIITQQPRNEKAKLAKKIGQIALNNNNPALYSTLKSRYRFGYTLKEVKSMVNRASYRCGDHKLLQTLKKSQTELIADLKKETNEFKIRMLTHGITRENMKTELAQNIIDLKMVPTEEMILNLIDTASSRDNNRWWGWEAPKISSDGRIFLTRIIRLLPEYKTREPEKLKNIVLRLIQKNGASMISTLSSKKYDLYSALTLNEIYTLCMQSMIQHKDIGTIIRILTGFTKSHELTPMIWTLVRMGVQYTTAEDQWSRIRPTKNSINNISILQKEIVLEDRQFFSSYIGTNRKLKTVKYEKTPEETPEEFDFYVRFIANHERENDMDSDDLELALDEVEADILEELGDAELDVDSMMSDLDLEENEYLPLDMPLDMSDDTHSDFSDIDYNYR